MFSENNDYPTYVGDDDTEREDVCDLEKRIREKKDEIINSMTEKQLTAYTELLCLERQYLEYKRKGA